MWGVGDISRAGKATGYDVVRMLLGLLLVTAAALNAHQLASEPAVGTGLLDSRWFLIGVVEFELLFAVWLCGGLAPRSERSRRHADRWGREGLLRHRSEYVLFEQLPRRRSIILVCRILLAWNAGMCLSDMQRPCTKEVAHVRSQRSFASV